MGENKSASMVTRADVMRMLGCSKALTIKLERRGKLRAVIDAKGVHHFARVDVIELARTRGRPFAERVEASVQAECFKLFRLGLELPEVVMQTKQTSATVRALYLEYKTPLEGLVGEPDLRDYDERGRRDDERLEELRRGAGRR
jgi:hypothetical protein